MVRKNGLPRRVYLRHSAYYFVSMAGKWHRLSAEKDGLPAMYRALANLQDAQTGERLPTVVAQWLGTKRAGWSVSQRRNIERVAAEISTAFAEFRPADVTTPDCAKYLQTLQDRPRTHNIHRNVLHQVLAWAAVQGLREGHNPTDNIKGLSTPGRKRVVLPEEIAAIRTAALADTTRKDSAGPALARMIELALITGQRIGDIIKMRWQDVSTAGLFVEQQKTGARILIQWTPDLRAAVDACAQGSERIGHLLKTKKGTGYKYAGIHSAWVRACKKAGVEDLTIHDMRGAASVAIEEKEGREAARNY